MMMPFTTTRAVLLLATAVGMMAALREIRHVEGANEGSVLAGEGEPEPTAALRRLIQNKPPSVAAGARSLVTPPVVLDFEGVGNAQLVGSFYDGVGGPDYGIVFGSSMFGLVDEDAGGTGFTANEPSPDTTLNIPNELNAFMTVSAGFTELSFYYTSDAEAVVTVLEGPDGSGAVLASIPLPKTGICGRDFPPCGDPNGIYGKWELLTVPFVGVAKSVRFTGFILDNLGVDDMTIVLAEPPCTKTTYWLWDPKTDTQVGELLDNSASCIAVPYNIEVRPCHPPATTPVFIKLTNAALKTIKRQNEYFAPFYLWGDTTSSGDVYKNTQPLPKGTYWLYSTIDGVQETIKFTKTC